MLEVTAFDEGAWTFFGVVVASVASVAGVVLTRYNAKKADRIEEKVDTGNERKLGEYVHDISTKQDAMEERVHDIAQVQELLSAQIHTNTREVVMASHKADRVEERVEERTDRIENKIDQHINEAKTTHARLFTEIEALKGLLEGGE